MGIRASVFNDCYPIIGETFTTHTHFGQWPLYVAGFSDIHQSLEAGLAQGDIETNNTDQTSNQEVINEQYVRMTE